MKATLEGAARAPLYGAAPDLRADLDAALKAGDRALALELAGYIKNGGAFVTALTTYLDAKAQRRASVLAADLGIKQGDVITEAHVITARGDTSEIEAAWPVPTDPNAVFA